MHDFCCAESGSGGVVNNIYVIINVHFTFMNGTMLIFFFDIAFITLHLVG